ncbi:MAG: plasmid pRiA4b ORF-3 family protein [Deltaproteobacteria bacterium]|nr:plasmid pRiA4b ORF-3 family protein [Deltaproteobacteria bacterium]
MSANRPKRKYYKYTFRVRYHGNVGNQHEPDNNWYRDIAVSDFNTLEQLSSVILDVLDWDPYHLYYFEIAGMRYEDLGIENYYVESLKNIKSVSCVVPVGCPWPIRKHAIIIQELQGW